MSDNLSEQVDRYDHEAVTKNATQLLKSISEIPPDQVESMLGIVVKRPEYDPESGELVHPRMFLCMGAKDEIHENINELIAKLSQLMGEHE